jgi:hypothetical protein
MLEVCTRSFRRYLARYEAEGEEWLLDDGRRRVRVADREWNDTGTSQSMTAPHPGNLASQVTPAGISRFGLGSSRIVTNLPEAATFTAAPNSLMPNSCVSR